LQVWLYEIKSLNDVLTMNNFSSKYLGILMLMVAWTPAMVYAQTKDPKNPKSVCSTNIPSRFSAINGQKKSTALVNTSTKKLSCCKGAPSRFTAMSSKPVTDKKQVALQK